ncbi:calumenin-A [Capsicum chacoense]
MSKVVVTAKITAFIFLVVLFIKLNVNNSAYYYTPKGLSRRLGLKIRDPIFDPLVAELEQKPKEKKNINNSSERSRKKEDDKYFDNDGRLKTTLRLMVLFPILDVAPKDGFIEYKELEVWNTQQTIDRLHYRTWKEMEFRDKDGDGAISFSEYFPQFTNEDIERNETSHGEAGFWMKQFRNADADRNGTLNLYEFRDFMHPEDSRNENIQRWLLREKIRQMDVNNDHKLNRLEFSNGAYNIYKTYLEYETQGSNIPTPFEAFAKLDFDGDEFLGVEELKPILRYLCPGELSYAKVYTTYLIREADDNKDGKLSLDEILNHESIFYDTVYDNGRNEDVFHEEL